VSNGFNAAQSAASNAMNTMSNALSNTWSTISSHTNDTMNTIRNNVSNAWSNITSTLSNTAATWRENISTMTKHASDFGGSVMNTLRSNVSSAWSNITQTIGNALSGIQKAVSTTTLKFGSVTIPTFSWTGKNDSEKGTTASIKVGKETVSYASAMSSGVILDRPTIFGALDGNLLRAGEAGKEVVIGANSLSSMIRQSATNTALNADVANILGLLAQYLPETANQNVVLDSGKLVGALTPALNRQFGMMIRG
jgi:Flp pilus assembly pilin Flp